jgi:hypothetical protein
MLGKHAPLGSIAQLPRSPGGPCLDKPLNLNLKGTKDKGIKRSRTQRQELPGREQLLITSPELQTRLGQKFCDETELLPLLLARGLLRRVRTIQLQVLPLGGDSFKITLDASKPTVGEAKAEIARAQGTAEARQELYKVAERADGLAVREDDAEPEVLEDARILLKDGEMVAMAVKELPLLWRTFAEDHVTLSEGGAVATQSATAWSLTTSGVVLTKGTHYWEVELLSKDVDSIFIGVSRPNLNPAGTYFGMLPSIDTTGLFIDEFGALYGNGKYNDDKSGKFNQGDRVGVLLDLSNGSLRFFKNGVQHGPGYPAGSVMGPVVHAVQFVSTNTSVRLLPDATAPIDV